MKFVLILNDTHNTCYLSDVCSFLQVYFEYLLTERLAIIEKTLFWQWASEYVKTCEIHGPFHHSNI